MCGRQALSEATQQMAMDLGFEGLSSSAAIPLLKK
jgi:hypothetical protein